MKYFNKIRTIEQKIIDRDVLFPLKKQNELILNFGRIKKIIEIYA